MKSEKKSMKKSIKKQNTNKIKWDHQNPRVVWCQTLNIKKYWIEGQNQKEKSNSQKNPNHKKTKKINFQRS
jgi:hypothetical protein